MPATPKSHRRSDSPSPPFGIRAVFQDLDGAEEAAEPDLVALCVRVRQPLAVRQAVGLLCWLAGLSRDQLWGRQNATERGEGSAVGAAWWLTALLHNGHGDYGEALAAARQAVEFEDVNFYGWALVELIEASVRSGRLDEAASALDRLSERTRASGTEWALGIEARCRALLTDDECRYRESVERVARSRAVVELARGRLLYGEWLRRENRRGQLRTAHEEFSQMGAVAFAERARRELSATGETVRKRTVETLDQLSTQEAQVARLAAQGHTNPETGAPSSSSARALSSITCTRYSRSSVSVPAESSGGCSLAQSTPLCAPSVTGRQGALRFSEF